MALCTMSPVQGRICPVHEVRGQRPPTLPMFFQAEEGAQCGSGWLHEPAPPSSPDLAAEAPEPHVATYPCSGWC